jgi:hypothetical protein
LASLPSPLPRAQVARLSGVALEFRTSRDLKSFADSLAARAGSLSADERYHLAKALEECLFTTNINEDLAEYSAKQKRQFLAGLPAGDRNNEKRIAAYETVDNTQRCVGFQNTKLSQREIDALFAAAAQQGDPRAQARIITAELSKTIGKSVDGQPARAPTADEFTLLTGLLETRDPDAIMYVGSLLAQNVIAQNLRIGPDGLETPDAGTFLGAFTLAACDVGQECGNLSFRELMQACAFAGFCDVAEYEQLYQNFLASPFAYANANRYRGFIHTAIDQHNWGLIGLTPKIQAAPAAVIPK